MHNEGKPFNISYEFYVSSSSKDLLKYLQQIMRKNGYLGLADGGGRLHYVLDGTKNLYETAHNIEKLVFGDTQGSSYYQKQIEKQGYQSSIPDSYVICSTPEKTFNKVNCSIA